MTDRPRAVGEQAPPEPHDDGGDELAELEAALDAALPTFAVQARFWTDAGSPEQAAAEVHGMVRAASDQPAEVSAGRPEADGRYPVIARFVVVSVDEHTAVAGVHDELRAAGLAVDEVWISNRYA